MLEMRLLALFLMSILTAPAWAASGLDPGKFSEFNVELPTELRKVAGHGKVSPVAHVLVTIGVPANFDAARDWPVLVISAPTDPAYHSSRRLLRAYAETALASGWIVMAADPAEDITEDRDDVAMRLALNAAALAVMKRQWPGASNASLAFGGFSNGAKVSGWLAAAFTGEGRNVLGIYLAGISEDTVVDGAMQFNVLNAAYKRVPIFLQAGEKDTVATPMAHQDVVDDLKRAGFKNVRIEYFAGAHEVDPRPLRTALDWFREVAGLPSNK